MNVARIIGLNRCKQAAIIASCGERFNSFSSISILSTNTIALLITIPAKEITPRKAINPKGTLKIKRPNTIPIIPKGMVNTIIVIFRIELNCMISNITIINPDNGKYFITAPMFSALLAASPPNS